jgi:L-lactate dehydrogenase
VTGIAAEEAMKLGVIGAGAVGSACVFALTLRGMARRIVLVDRTRERARAVATDMRYGAPLAGRVEIEDGDYADLAGCGLVMITSGVNEKSGGATDRGDREGRLKLLETNAGIYREIVPRIVAAAAEAVILVVTDPPDPLADLARRLAGHRRVLSTGTYLDSLRLRVHLGRALGIDPAQVEAQILGEHGTSEVFVWSGVRIAGVPLDRVLHERGLAPERFRAEIEREVRYANIAIIEGNKASQYGIGMVSARIAEMVLRDERAAIPIGVRSERYGVTLSLPAVLGAGGAREILAPLLSDDEEKALQHSAETLRRALERVR